LAGEAIELELNCTDQKISAFSSFCTSKASSMESEGCSPLMASSAYVAAFWKSVDWAMLASWAS
jgi:hypothetical protein